MTKKSLLIIFFICISISIFSQEVKWSIECPTEAYSESPFEVSFVLENAKGSDFVPPKFKNVKVLSGPSISTSMQIINGESSSSSAYIYTVVAKEKGEVIIEPSSIKIKGKTLTTKQVAIKISEAKIEKSNKTNKDLLVFLKAKPSAEKIYAGQQVMLQYILYYAENIGLADELNLPSYDGFFTKKLNNAKSVVSSINDGNHLYEGMVIEAVAIYPTKQGQKEVLPATARIKKRKPNSDPFFDPYNAYEESAIKSNILNFTIKPLPEGAPLSFTGAVGKYQAEFTVLQKQSSKGSLVLNVEIIGDGDSKQVGPPVLNLMKPLKSTEPKLLHEKEYFENDKILHQKKYEYLIFSDEKVNQQIIPEFSYFNPESEKYETIKSSPIEVVLEKSSADNAGKFYKGADTKKSDDSGNLNLFILIGSVLLSTIFGLQYFIRNRKKDSSLNNELNDEERKEKARINAGKIALSKLEKANQHLSRNELDLLYSEIGNAINGYLQEKYQISTEAMKKANIRSILSAHLKDDHTQSLAYEEIMQKVDLSMYAGYQSKSAQQIFEAAKSFIEEIEMK